jgi:5'-nucleotidase
VLKRIALVPVLLLSLLALAAPAQAHGRHSLRILLTNDDGYTSAYLDDLREALVGAGHEVTVVAPESDASITGTAINANFGSTIQASQKSSGVWSVGGSPSDAVAFGVGVVFAGDPPDLVVSGPNPGENVAATANYSGTVGAAITAITGGVPAVAFSMARSGGSFPNEPQAVAFAVKVVNRLAATTSYGRVLPDHIALSVNYPVTPNGKVTVARLGTSLPYSTGYAPAPAQCGACYVINPVPASGPDPVPNADRTLLAAGDVTVTPLDGSWEAGSSVSSQVRSRLSSLTP